MAKYNFKHHRIYYVPGMISLIFIPIFSYLLIKKHLKEIWSQRCVEIVMCSKDTTSWFCCKCVYPHRNYIIKYLTGNETGDAKVLDSINSLANSLRSNEDTINGIKVIFQDHAKYKSFIKIIDICKINKIPKYMAVDNEFVLVFDYIDLKLGDKTYKTIYIDCRRRLLKGDNHDYEILIKDKPDNFAFEYEVHNDIVYDKAYFYKQEIEKRNRQLHEFINQRRIPIGFLCLVYLVLIFLTYKKY
jgi:hypothetical protein